MFNFILNFFIIYLILLSSKLYSSEDSFLNINDNIKYKMVYVKERLIFPFGNDNKKTTIRNAYKIADKEISYEFWYFIYSWAIQKNYSFLNSGSKGYSDTNITNDKHPLTNISWLDAIIWTNALTDYYNENLAQDKDKLIHTYYQKDDNNKLTFLKKPISDNKIIKIKNSTGFRLLNSYEWELAARYIGKTNPGTNSNTFISIKQNNFIEPLNINYFFNLNTVSGFYNQKNKEISDYAWFNSNSRNSTHEVAKKEPNDLGLYDMSGNVGEFIYDAPFIKGGSFYDGEEKIKVSYNINNNVNNKNPNINIGFRIGMNSN
jgi:formylglycine-generating enzyme